MGQLVTWECGRQVQIGAYGPLANVLVTSATGRLSYRFILDHVTLQVYWDTITLGLRGW